MFERATNLHFTNRKYRTKLIFLNPTTPRYCEMVAPARVAAARGAFLAGVEDERAPFFA